MKKENKKRGNKLVLWIVICVIAIVLAAYYLMNKPSSSGNSSLIQDENSIPSENFVFTSSFYLNEKTYDKSYCDKSGECHDIKGNVIGCPKVDQLTLRYKVIGFDNLAFLSCDVGDGEDSYEGQHFAFYPLTKVAELTIQNVDYSKSHNFVICCIYDDKTQKSDEFCLKNLEIKSLC